MRIADPRPSLCTGCGNAGSDETRFVDCESVREGPVVLDPETRQIAIDPQGAQVVFDDVFLCDACVREMAELIGYKPDLHSRQFTEIRRQDIRIEHLEAYAKRLEKALEIRPDIQPARRKRVA